MYMVMLVLDDPDLVPRVLDAWQKAGVTGATAMESTGMHRIQAARARLHARFDLAHIADESHEYHSTLFAVLPDLDMVQSCLAATERVTGDLEEPGTGIFAAWPLALVKGLVKRTVRGASR